MNSSFGGKVQLTLTEIISTLKRSSLPTVIIEGKDDLIVFRKLEDKFESIGLSILPVGGRKMVLELFDSDSYNTNKKVMFIADKDTWIHTDIPKEYQSEKLLFTTGYSIENDIISDGNLEGLMSAKEKLEFKKELELFTCWYADAIAKHLVNRSLPIENHPNQILDNATSKNSLIAKLASKEYPDLYHMLLADYITLIRGKSLLNLLMRHLSYKHRIVRHHPASLFDTVAHNPKGLLSKFAVGIESFFLSLTS